MLGQGERAYRPGEAEVAGVVERLHPGVLEILGPEHAECLLLAVALEHLGDVDDRDRVRTLGGEQRDRAPGADPLHVVIGQRERDRDRPRQPVRQVHRLQDGDVVVLPHEPRQRGQRPDGEHLQVGELPGVDHELGQVVGLGAGGISSTLGDEQVDELAAVRGDRRVVGHGTSTFRRGERTLRIAAGRSAPTRDLYSLDPHDRGPMSDTLLSDEALRALNARLEPAHPGEIVRWALEESGLRELALASAFQAEGTCVMHMATRIRPDVPVLFLETGFHFAETLAFKRAADRAPGPERGRADRRAHAGHAAGGVRSPPVRARSGAVLPDQQGGADARGAARPRGVGHGVPARLVSDPGRGADRRPVRARARQLDRQGEPGRELDAPRHVGVPEGARAAPQPALRPRVRLDRLRAVHPPLAPGRTRARGPVGRSVEVGVRDPGTRRWIRGGRRDAAKPG